MELNEEYTSIFATAESFRVEKFCTDYAVG